MKVLQGCLCYLWSSQRWLWRLLSCRTWRDVTFNEVGRRSVLALEQVNNVEWGDWNCGCDFILFISIVYFCIFSCPHSLPSLFICSFNPHCVLFGSSIFLCQTSVPTCHTIQCHIPEDSNRLVCSCSVFRSFIHRTGESTSPTVLLILQITLSSVKLYLPFRVACYHAVCNETLVDFEALKIVCINFLNKLNFSLLILRLFYVFIACVSYVLVAKRGVSH
jgi:hypothetical protein